MSATTRRAAPKAAPAPAPTGRSSPLDGTGSLIRLILRRDRIRIPVWILGLSAGVVGTAMAFADLYPTQEEIDLRNAVVSGNPVGVLFSGPGYGLDGATPDNIGPLVVNELSATMIVLFALMNLFLVVRYTRSEEESGRGELVRSGVVGRTAPLTAALIVMVGVNVVTGALIAVGLAGQDLGWEGSLSLGASLALFGLVIAGVAAICGQISEYGRTAVGVGGAVFGLAFMIRAIGDIQDSDLRWLSPVGWAQGMRPYAGEEWWPAFALAGLAVALAAIAFLLNIRRDFGAAMIRARRGRPAATPFLASPWALALRQHRGAVIGWTVAVVATAIPVGAILTEEAESLTEMDVFQQIMGGEALEIGEILGFYLGFIALIVGAFTLQIVLRARSEETEGRAEPLLAASVSRWQWAGSHLAVAIGATALILVATGFGMGLAAAVQADDTDLIAATTGDTVANLPALAALAGLAFALYGVAPRLAPLVWAPFAYFAFVGMFGELLDLPEEALDVSPFIQVSNAVEGDFSAAPLLWLSGIAIALMAVGFWGFARRDLKMV